MSLLHFLKDYYTIFFVWLTGTTVAILYRKSWSLPMKVFAWFVMVYVLFDTAGNVMAGIYKMNNHFFYNLIYTVQFLVLAFFFYYQLDSHLIKKVIRVYFWIFPLFVLINTIFFQGFYTWQTYSFVFGGIFVILLSIAYLWQLYDSEETQSIFRDPVFWFSLSLLLYFTVTVPYFGMLNYLLQNYPVFSLKYYLLVIDISFCLHNIVMTIGFLCLKGSMK